MATATATPKVDPIVEPTWSQRFRAWLKKKTQQAGNGLKKAGSSVKNAAVKSASWSWDKAKKAGRGVARGTKWTLVMLGFAAKGSAFYLMRGLGYVVYGLAWVIGTVLAIALVAVSFVIFAAVAAIAVLAWIIGWTIDMWMVKVAGFFRWLAHGGTRNKLSDYTTRTGLAVARDGDRMTTGMRRKVVNTTQGVMNTLLDDRVQVEDYAVDPAAATIRVERYTDGAHSDEWATLDETAMNNYSGRPIEDVLDRHKQHRHWLHEQGGHKNAFSYWTGRIYTLSRYLRDEDSPTALNMEQHYQDWLRVETVGNNRKAFNKQKVREGMKDEVAIIKGRLGEGSMGEAWRQAQEGIEQHVSTATASS